MTTFHRKSYTRTINSKYGECDDAVKKTLHLMMISCEDSAPYGPSDNTANMFLSLLEKAFKVSQDPSCSTVTATIIITVYEAKQEDYPESEQEWNAYDGILLPGSFSSAYASEDWIEKLKSIIQTEIHVKQRKTMALCFGHQVFAHSFGGHDSSIGGLAIPCPASVQVGPSSFECSVDWIPPPEEASSMQTLSTLTPSVSYTLLATHGDMVHSLPLCATALGGTEKVPIQAAVYLTEEGKPYTYSFQGHPEYACDIGLETFSNILNSMIENDKLPRQVLDDARADAISEFKSVERDSVHVMQIVGRNFGWI